MIKFTVLRDYMGGSEKIRLQRAAESECLGDHLGGNFSSPSKS